MNEKNTWQGIPRNEVPWFPTVDAETCTSCGECYRFCGHGVYAWDDANDKPIVRSPYSCVVGCSSCASGCASGAISFPPLTMLKELKAKHGK